MTRTAAFLMTLFVAGSSAQADEPAAGPMVLAVDSGASTVTYHIVHKFHKIDGVSKKVEGRARILADGQTQVGMRAAVESFDSGNGNRDAHMKEVTEAAKFPLIDLKALGTGIMKPTSYPMTVEKMFQGEVTFHGIHKPIEVTAKLTFDAKDRVRVQAHFAISLDEFKVERPSLLFVKVDDKLEVDASLVFKG